ncbi:septal ring lytic transglycosylase RlpA family protein [Crenothrix sp.]|uniref:septal ring lytic transglycosylase RlpA family protein n=1 Tax=Crenothrix sp. TaxID=3100433 RepID=UPI00374DE079
MLTFNNSLLDEKKLRFNSRSSGQKWFFNVIRAILIGTLVVYAFDCDSAQSGHKSKKHPHKKGSVSSKVVHKQVGKASWYGTKFQGKETASGETFNQKALTAAHPTLPMGTKAEVTNLENGKKVDVEINDRGPYTGGRAIDLSKAAANKLDMKKDGTSDVKIETQPPTK